MPLKLGKRQRQTDNCRFYVSSSSAELVSSRKVQFRAAAHLPTFSFSLVFTKAIREIINSFIPPSLILPPTAEANSIA